MSAVRRELRVRHNVFAWTLVEEVGKKQESGGEALSPTSRDDPYRMSEKKELKSGVTEDNSGLPDPNTTVTETKLFSGLNALEWSAGVAVLTAFATCLGMIREAGRSSALALYSLSRPAIDQRDTYIGMSSLLAATLLSLLPFAVTYLVYRSARWSLGKTALYRWFGSCWTKAHRFLPWVALIAVLADVGFLNASIVRLTSEAEGIILKHTSEAGTVWTDILLDEDLAAASGYMFLFGAGVAFFVGVSWWLIDKRVERRLSQNCIFVLGWRTSATSLTRILVPYRSDRYDRRVPNSGIFGDGSISTAFVFCATRVR